MKLSINKLLIGLLFVFSVILIPTDVAKANTYIVAWDYIPGWGTCKTTVDLGLTVDSPHKYIVAAGGVSNDNGCSGGTIKINGKHMPAGGSKVIFTGPTSSSGGGATFDSLADGWHFIQFTGSVSKIGMANYSFEIGTLGAEIVSTDPTVTVYANGKSAETFVGSGTARITWDSFNANSCTCTYSGGPCGSSTGSGSGQGGQSFTVSSTKTFNVTCNN